MNNTYYQTQKRRIITNGLMSICVINYKDKNRNIKEKQKCCNKPYMITLKHILICIHIHQSKNNTESKRI